MSLRGRLFLMAMATLLPVFAAIVAFGLQLRDYVSQDATEQVTRQTQRAQSELVRIVETVRALIVSISSVPAVADFSDPECTSYLQTLAAAMPEVSSIGVLDLDGNIRCIDDPKRPRPNYADRDYFKAARNSDELFVGVYTPARTEPNRKVLPIAMRFLDRAGQVRGVVAIGLDLNYLNRVIGSWALPEQASITIADREGTVIARNPLPERFVGTKIPSQFRHWINAPAPGTAVVTSQDGTVRLLSYAPIDQAPKGLYVSSGVSTAIAYSALGNTLAWAAGIAVLGILGALLSSYLAGRYFVSRPFRRLRDLAQRWQMGEHPGTTIGGPKEFHEIASALNAMGDALRKRSDIAEMAREQMRRSVQMAPYPILIEADDGEIIQANDSWWHQAGFKAATGTRLPPRLWPTDRDSPSPYAIPFEQDVARREWSFTGADGKPRKWEFGTVLLGSLPDGRRFRLIAGADLSERILAEQQKTLLVHELNHRVKNTLAIVQAIGARTASSTNDPAAFQETFTGRLVALARTHDLLTRETWHSVDLRELLEVELRTVQDAAITYDGPPVSVPPQVAVSIGLILHELVTNAVKYGCLLENSGRLSISWTFAADERLLRLVWIEHCASPMKPMGKRGFGSQLIERTLKSIGEGGSEFTPTGLRFTMSVRLPESSEALI